MRSHGITAAVSKLFGISALLVRMHPKIGRDHGFDTASAKDLQARLKPLIRKTQPYNKKIAHRGIWVEPEVLAEIEYRAKSAEGKVRHPFFKGIREDL
jgi:bifunctional non-homologous end joining protein LigD